MVKAIDIPSINKVHEPLMISACPQYWRSRGTIFNNWSEEIA